MTEPSNETLTPKTLVKDAIAGLIVFLVALPLCLGIALASNASPFSGLIAGIIGGIVVGCLSGSHTSVSGPAAGLTAIVSAQIAKLGSFDTFLLAVVIGGVLQIGLGLMKAGALSAFFPSSVIRGLLAAIGVILIIKQTPKLFGHMKAAHGPTSASGHGNPFGDLWAMFDGNFHYGAMAIGLISLAFLFCWDQIKPLKKSLVPAPLLVVLLGVVLGRMFDQMGAPWQMNSSLLVDVPTPEKISDFGKFLQFPDFSQLTNSAVYVGGLTLCIVASLETLLNLEAVDKLDKKQRNSPASRELWAQGAGNVACGLLGGLPVTSVIIRSSVNVNAGAESKLSAIFHGVLLLVCVVLIPTYLNMIPHACLAAILLMTGFKLASIKLFREMLSEGRYQFLPFIITLSAIVLTDLLVGILIGLGVSLVFILISNLRQPIRRTREKHIGGEVLHVELANQVSFLNRAALDKILREAPRDSHVLLDARHTDYIDPDILSLIREFKNVIAPAHGVQVSLRGFREKYQLEDEIQFVNYATRELHDRLTPAQVVEILREGNERFCAGRRLDRELGREAQAEEQMPHPMAVIFTGIDSRSPAELIFDLGLGDAFTIRMPGIVVGPRTIGGMEYACLIGKVKLILVMGHTHSGLVTTAIEHLNSSKNAQELTGCPNLETILAEIAKSAEPSTATSARLLSPSQKAALVDEVSRRHVVRTIGGILEQSPAIAELAKAGRVGIAGAMYDMTSGRVEFMLADAVGISQKEISAQSSSH